MMIIENLLTIVNKTTVAIVESSNKISLSSVSTLNNKIKHNLS